MYRRQRRIWVCVARPERMTPCPGPSILWLWCWRWCWLSGCRFWGGPVRRSSRRERGNATPPLHSSLQLSASPALDPHCTSHQVWSLTFAFNPQNFYNRPHLWTQPTLVCLRFLVMDISKKKLEVKITQVEDTPTQLNFHKTQAKGIENKIRQANLTFCLPQRRKANLYLLVFG